MHTLWLCIILLIPTQLFAVLTDKDSSHNLLESLYGLKPKTIDRALLKQPPAITLEFCEKREIDRLPVYLGDLSRCEGPQDRCQEISTILIGSSPVIGRQKWFERENIKDVIDKEGIDADIAWQGPIRCQVFTNGTLLDSLPFVSSLEAQWDPNLVKEMRHRILSVRFAKSFRLRHDRYDFSLKFSKDLEDDIIRNARRTFFNAIAVAKDRDPDSNEIYEIPIQLQLRSETWAYKANSNLSASFSLLKSSLELAWVPYGENLLRESDAFEGMVLRTPLRAGQSVRIRDLIREPDIKKGATIDALVRHDGVKMNSPAQALDSGFIGQKIRVQLGSTKRQLSATVVSMSQVEVHTP